MTFCMGENSRDHNKIKYNAVVFSVTNFINVIQYIY